MVWHYLHSSGGWQAPRIVERKAAMLELVEQGAFGLGGSTLHYGQAVFEGAKAFPWTGWSDPTLSSGGQLATHATQRGTHGDAGV